MDSLLTLAPTAQPSPEPITLAPPSSVWPSAPTEDQATRRAFRTSYAGLLDDDQQDIRNRIIQNQEAAVRQQAAFKIDVQNRQQNAADLRNVLADPTGSLDPQQFNTPPTNPDTVIEKYFNKTALGALNTAAATMQGTHWTDTLANIPGFVDKTTLAATDFGTKRDFVANQLEEAEKAVKNQGWPGYLFDAGLNLSQIYTEGKERGNSAGFFEGGGLSSNIKAQADADFTLSNDDFANTVGPRLKKLIATNPQMAVDYMTRYLGESERSATAGDIFTIAAPIDLALGAKGLWNAGKKITGAMSVRKAVNDILEEGKKPTATASSIQAAAGDLGGSAVKDVTQQVAEQMSGTWNPVKYTMQGMTENFNLIIGEIGTGTPRNREMVTRMQETLGSRTTPIGPTILQMNKVNRVGDALKGEEEFQAVRGAIQQDYRGPWNSLLNVRLDKDSWNPFTNGWDYKLDIGTMNGEYYRDPKTAAKFAKDNGFGDARIIEGVGPLESAEKAADAVRVEELKGNIVTLQAQQAKLRKMLDDPTISKEDKKPIRAEINRIEKEDIRGHRDEINSLNYKAAIEPNQKRLAQLKTELEHYRNLDPDIKRLFKDEHKAKLDQIGQEMRALNFGRASAIDRNPVIKQQGVGYYIQVTKPLDETHNVLRDLMIKNIQGELRGNAISDATSGVSSWKNAIIGKYRSPEDTLSRLESEQRKTATYSKAVLEKLADGLGQYIEDVARGRIRFREDGTPIPWYLSTPRYVAGIPYRIAKNLAGSALEKTLGKEIGSQRQMFSEWERTVDFARRNKSPTGETGWFFQSQAELEDHYLRTFDRMPSYAESLAYFAKVELDEFNRVLTNMAVYRNKARIGTMSHQIVLTDGAGRTLSSAFDGVQRKTLPGGEENIVVFDNSSGKPSKVYDLSKIHGPLREQWREQVITGKLKVIELWDPETRPLNGFGNVENQRIRYVLADAVDSKPISYNQVNRRGGGHFDYEYEHYLKQAIIRREEVGGSATAHYEGDMTVMALPNRVMGHAIGEDLDKVRTFIKEGRIDEARDYTKAKLMMEFDGDDGVWSWFKPGRDKDGKITPPRLNMDENFHVVPKGKNIFGLDAALEKRMTDQGYRFSDGTRSGSLARQFQVAYTNERDAYNLIAPDNVGTSVRPLYKYEPAKMVDAMPTMQRALNRAIKSTFMDDYKMFAVEHWLREAEPWLKESSDVVRSSPFYHFHNPEWRDGAPHETEKNLEFNRQKILQFIGIPSEFDTTMHALAQKLADSAYEHGVAAKLAAKPELSSIRSLNDTRIVPVWMLNRVHDPILKLRSIVYNYKLGLFNIPQLLVQAQTHANIWAISGRNGGAGTYATLLHTWSRFGDDSFLQHLDSYATKVNFLGVKWKPGEFMEARKELAKTGFEHVGGEFATLDDFWGHKFVGNDFNSFLSLGQTFFKEGERSTRLSAWYTAYKEFRDTKPIGIISNEDRSKILQRADLLTANMSRASNSALHTGVLSLTTQFLSYQLRLAELFMGKRLGETAGERAMMRMRMLGVYAGLYGIPAAVGVTGLPVSEDIRGAAINYGYVPGQNWLSSLAVEGIPSLITALVTGEGELKNGRFYNFGDRYGAQGFTQFREALRSDGTWWRILGGAGISTAVNQIANLDGFSKAMVSFLKQDNPDQRFKLKTEDVIDAGKEISSVNAAWRLIIAMNTGKWVNKNEQDITRVSTTEAAFMTLAGLSPQAQDDLFVKGNLVKSREAVFKYAKLKFTEELHRSIQAKENNNQDQAHDFLRRAFSYLEAGNVPHDQRTEAIANALKGWESRVDSQDYSFYLRNVPTNDRDAKRETYRQILKDRQK